MLIDFQTENANVGISYTGFTNCDLISTDICSSLLLVSCHAQCSHFRVYELSSIIRLMPCVIFKVLEWIRCVYFIQLNLHGMALIVADCFSLFVLYSAFR